MQVSNLLEFSSCSSESFKADATQAMCRDMQLRYGEAVILPIDVITTASGDTRPVHGVVLADQCAAVLMAVPVLDDQAVMQLQDCLDFMRQVRYGLCSIYITRANRSLR